MFEQRLLSLVPHQRSGSFSPTIPLLGRQSRVRVEQMFVGGAEGEIFDFYFLRSGKTSDLGAPSYDFQNAQDVYII